MKQENKELLLRDLCARLPYGVYVLVHDTFEYSTVPFEKVYLKSSDISSLIDSISLNERYNSKDKRFNRIIKERKDFLEFKPYLFPLSSMTEEQKIECFKVTDIELDEHNEIWSTFPISNSDIVLTNLDNWLKVINWLNKNHFDYRGLIEKSLALDATNLGIYE